MGARNNSDDTPLLFLQGKLLDRHLTLLVAYLWVRHRKDQVIALNMVKWKTGSSPSCTSARKYPEIAVQKEN